MQHDDESMGGQRPRAFNAEEHHDLVVETAIERGMLDKIMNGHRVVPVKWIEDYRSRHPES